jgi:hypothetical protein
MKGLLIRFIFVFSLFAVACSSAGVDLEKMQALEKRLAEVEKTSKKGLGSMMNQIQVYHTKLYHATINQNTALMAYVLHEIDEVFDDVLYVHNEHDGVEIGKIAANTILPALSDFEKIVANKDTAKYIEAFDYLTVNCNKCHVTSGHEFIRIGNPTQDSYLNQDFKRLD